MEGWSGLWWVLTGLGGLTVFAGVAGWFESPTYSAEDYLASVLVALAGVGMICTGLLAQTICAAAEFIRPSARSRESPRSPDA